MQDSFHREITYLRISVTDLCNLRCQYCMNEKGVNKLQHEQIISPERIGEIVSTAAKLGIKKVRLTGGEPLVRHGIVDIVRIIHQIPGIEEIAMTTNGVYLKELAKPLFEAGLNRLNISLDSLSFETYAKLTRVGRLADVLVGIKSAQEAGFKNIKINTVLIGGVNDREVDSFIKFAKDNSLTVRFIELMPIGESLKFAKESFISNESISNREDLEYASTDGVSHLYHIKGSEGYIGLISPLSNRFCKECNRIRLTADGKLKPCLHSAMEIDTNGKHGEELEEVIKTAIMSKPKEHHLESGNSEAIRNMNEIGG